MQVRNNQSLFVRGRLVRVLLTRHAVSHRLLTGTLTALLVLATLTGCGARRTVTWYNNERMSTESPTMPEPVQVISVNEVESPPRPDWTGDFHRQLEARSASGRTESPTRFLETRPDVAVDHAKEKVRSPKNVAPISTNIRQPELTTQIGYRLTEPCVKNSGARSVERIVSADFDVPASEPADIDPGAFNQGFGTDDSGLATSVTDEAARAATSLESLEAQAVSGNPQLLKLKREVQSAWSRASYQDKLPDPQIGANVFGNPIETASGSYRANLMVSQMVPWLERLDAKSQQAWCEAMVLQQLEVAQRLNVIADLRAAWYQLYVLERQIEITEANKAILKTLIEVANARVSIAAATSGDVSLAALELSRLQERIITLREQVYSTKARINQLAGRPSGTPIESPHELVVKLPAWTHEGLRDQAVRTQPAVAARQLEAKATRWGVEVARLKQRPEFAFSASWYLIDDNRPDTTVVDVGRDAWSVGAQVSIPLWKKKYAAMKDEATWKHFAAHSSTDQIVQELDARLRSQWEQARAAAETAELYRSTIIPQAKQTFDSDQQSLGDSAVEFDRVMQDFRNLVTLELEYHRALGRLATALARIRQTVGTDHVQESGLVPPAPAVLEFESSKRP